MSTDTSSSPAAATSTKQTPTVRTRSLIEKIFIWTLISAIVLFCVIEVRAHQGYQQTLAGVQSALDEADVEKKFLTLEDLGANIKYFPTREQSSDEDKHVVKLKWWSILRPDDYEIHLHAKTDDDNPVVMYLSTPGRADEEQPVRYQVGNGAGNEPPMLPGAGPGGPGGGSRQFDPDAIVKRIMEDDKNKDGKLSKDEWPKEGRRRTFLERADADKNDEVTEEEMKKAFANRPKRKRRGSRGRPDGGARKRQRPPMEEDNQGNKKPAKASETKSKKKTEKKAAG